VLYEVTRPYAVMNRGECLRMVRALGSERSTDKARRDQTVGAAAQLGCLQPADYAHSDQFTKLQSGARGDLPLQTSINKVSLCSLGGTLTPGRQAVHRSISACKPSDALAGSAGCPYSTSGVTCRDGWLVASSPAESAGLTASQRLGWWSYRRLGRRRCWVRCVRAISPRVGAVRARVGTAVRGRGVRGCRAHMTGGGEQEQRSGDAL